MKLPNLVIAGAPKAGSSSLFYWLASHPEVYGAPCKETFFFIDRDSSLLRPKANYHLHGLDLYESFFPDCPDDAKVILEATPHYIYQKTALEFFANCDPQPHVVFLLRNPAKRVFSSFSFAQNYLNRLDSNLTFEKVTDLLLDTTGKLARDIDYEPDSFFWEWLNTQLPNNRYYDFIVPWTEHFPPEKIHIILFEEMVANPRDTLMNLANSMGIDANFYQGFYFEKRTQTVAVKNKFAHALLLKLAPYYASAGKLRSVLKSLYFMLNSTKPKPASLNSIQRLDKYFQPYNQKLADKFNLNLDFWR